MAQSLEWELKTVEIEMGGRISLPAGFLLVRCTPIYAPPGSRWRDAWTCVVLAPAEATEEE